jgi:ribonuclease VapC
VSPAACVIDTSALVALLDDELDAGALWAALRRFERHVIPASAYLKFVMATSERAGSRGWIDTFVAVFRTDIYPVESWVAGEAADAFERFGRGSGHRARLNFGDGMSYGVAAKLSLPLLFKRDDFPHTDIKRAL